jgi:hypothetical protein
MSLFTFVLVFKDGHVTQWPKNIYDIRAGFADISESFIGIDRPPSNPPNSIRSALLFGSHAIGFFVLGLWIGVAANKLGRLSSE